MTSQQNFKADHCMVYQSCLKLIGDNAREVVIFMTGNIHFRTFRCTFNLRVITSKD